MWAWIGAAVVLVIAAALVIVSDQIFKMLFTRKELPKEFPAGFLNSPFYKVAKPGIELMEKTACEDVYITAQDGLKLHGYFYPTEAPMKKFVLYVHGYQSYAREEFAPFFAFYRSMGYAVLVVDDRAHGQSEGKYVGFGVLDRLDCMKWLNYLVERFGEDIRIQLHGISMGAATVMAVSGEKEIPNQVQGIVADCGFTSGYDALKFLFKTTAHLPAFPLLNLCEGICKVRAGYGFHEHTPIEQVRKTHVPILFVQGDKDTMVPPHMAQELYSACSAKKKLLVIPGAGHADSVALAQELYFKTIRDFFDGL